MKTFFFLLFALITSTNLFAQPTNRSEPVLNTEFGRITEFIAPKEKNLNTIYLNDQWMNGTVYLKNNQKIKGFKINYDLELDRIEFQAKNEIKILPGDQAISFALWVPNRDSLRFINCNQFDFEPLYFGFYEIVKDGGKMQLLKKIKIDVLRANFNPITNTGYKTDKVIKKERYYLANGPVVTLIKSDFDTSFFAPKENEIKAFAKTNKLSFKRPEDLVKLVHYFNSI